MMAALASDTNRLAQLARRAWWLHSFGALGIGVSVMLFARKGLAYADKLLLVVVAAWLLVFVALRVVGGPRDDGEEEHLARRGLRVVTNYVIKNLYQQVFFFLLPLYASSATWTLDSPNLWLPIVLGACAVISTMDVIFDQFIMRRRWLVAMIYGVGLFGVLNLLLPLLTELTHLKALLIAAASAPAATALLSFRVRSVLTPAGLAILVGATALTTAAVWFGRVAVPPAPLAMIYGAVGHGAPGEYEVMPGRITHLRSGQLAELRCATQLAAPGGLHDTLVHVWRQRREVVARLTPEEVPSDEPTGHILLSRLPELPADPLGKWSCTLETSDGQLVGRVRFVVIP
jgi:hypothetical protein